jgi:hypothetical protein
MLIAEFTLSTPVLRDALAAAPGTTVDVERSTNGPPTRLSVLARGTDINRFEDALSHDDSVRASDVRARSGSFGQYEVTLTAAMEGRSPTVWSQAEGVEPLSGVGSNQGWEFRMRFPDREALAAYRNRCRERDIAFTLHDLFRRTDGLDDHPDTPVGGTVDGTDCDSPVSDGNRSATDD